VTSDNGVVTGQSLVCSRQFVSSPFINACPRQLCLAAADKERASPKELSEGVGLDSGVRGGFVDETAGVITARLLH